MNYTIFDAASGRVLWSGVCEDADYEHLHVPDGASKMPVSADPFRNYVSDGVVLEIPPYSSPLDRFDYTTKTVIRATDQQVLSAKWDVVRAERDRLLSMTVDRINPIRWEALSQEQRAAVAEYRDALLDVTKQSDPDNVLWPSWPLGDVQPVRIG